MAPDAEPKPIRDCTDEELEIRAREGDVLARDVLSLRRWRDGHREAGVDLLDRYAGYFHQLCMRCGVDGTHERDEVYQEVVLDLVEHLADVPDRVEKSFAGFYAWRIRNAILRVRRKTGSSGVSLEDAGPAADATAPDAGASAMMRLESWEGIERCWKRLPPREHRVFELRFLQESSLKEIAAALGSNVNAVGQAIFRLSKKMKECLSRHGYEP